MFSSLKNQLKDKQNAQQVRAKINKQKNLRRLREEFDLEEDIPREPTRPARKTMTDFEPEVVHQRKMQREEER